MHDAISRSAMMEFAKYFERLWKDEPEVSYAYNMAWRQACIATALDVEPVIHAMWKDGICTACGCENPRTRQIGDDGYPVPTLYCPDCGARMDAKEE